VMLHGSLWCLLRCFASAACASVAVSIRVSGATFFTGGSVTGRAGRLLPGIYRPKPTKHI
jgi:hypothetical protein